MRALLQFLALWASLSPGDPPKIIYLAGCALVGYLDFDFPFVLEYLSDCWKEMFYACAALALVRAAYFFAGCLPKWNFFAASPKL